MKVAKYNLDIAQGSDYVFRFKYLQPDKTTPVDLSNYNIHMQVRVHPSDLTALDTLTSESDDEIVTPRIIYSSDGFTECYFTHEATENYPVGKLYYDLELVNKTTNKVVRILQGRINVTAEVTKVNLHCDTDKYNTISIMSGVELYTSTVNESLEKLNDYYEKIETAYNSLDTDLSNKAEAVIQDANNSIDSLKSSYESRFITVAKNYLTLLDNKYNSIIQNWGQSGNQITFTLEADVNANEYLTFPDEFSYVVSRHQLLVFVDGVLLPIGEAYLEYGSTDTFSHTIQALTTIKAGSKITAVATIIGAGPIDEVITTYNSIVSTYQAMIEYLENLTNKIVYTEKLEE